MVQVQVKHSGGGEGEGEEVEFLYDCQSTSTVDDIASDLSQISNLQTKILRIFHQLQPRLSLHRRDSKVMTLIRALSESNSYASKDLVLRNKPLSLYVLRDHLKSIEREFSANYRTLGFPDSNLQQLLTDLELLQEDTVELLWAGKELHRGKQLCDYIGKNEKTKILLRLQPPSPHPAC
ncbi:uncharacterized protein LOC127798365 [Diospyros lotus]|uniref:uncharacterized protein LOC127798365 n=1 Tax=Diospyros lotus TaxID=55363 RepID=UPI00224F72CA|nr:uncharacterized protein LOC127798365 [Diospyros lotus]